MPDLFEKKAKEKKPRKTSEEKRLNLIEELRDFGLSVNSFREIFKAKTVFWKVVWVCFGLACLGYCLSEIGNLLNRLIAVPTATSIRYKVNSSVLFPVISICTYARVNASDLKQYNISSELLSFMFSAFKGLYLFYNEGANQMDRAPGKP